MYKGYVLFYKTVVSNAVVNATGNKSYYFSINQSAVSFGYQPNITSIEGVLMESEKCYDHHHNKQN
jgi:hypothetical protein